MNEVLKKPLYPYVFYVPAFLVVVHIFFANPEEHVNRYVREGPWIYIYLDDTYFITMLVSCLLLIPYYVMLSKGKKRVYSKRDEQLLTFMSRVVIVVFLATVFLGMPFLRGILPPKPFYYVGLLFGGAIIYSMYRYNFLSNENDQYETLFELNPSPVLIFTADWKLDEWNESAKLFDLKQHIEFDQLVQYYGVSHILHQTKIPLEQGMTIRDIEVSVKLPGAPVTQHFLIDGKRFLKNRKIAYFFIVRDVTREKEAMTKLEYIAYHDQLTGVANRGSFVKLSERFIENNPTKVAYFGLLDLDYFKAINDFYGHQVGDDVLRRTAQLLQQFVGPSGRVGRLGGDEFVFAIVDIEAFPSVEIIIKRLSAYYKANGLVIGEDVIPIIPSIGVSTYPAEGQTYDELYSLADIRMYSMKNERKVRRINRK
jgi:diguanylate cyclase (GGDEF)-like protein